jgi:C-terminal processing protease CtpA/Prc
MITNKNRVVLAIILLVISVVFYLYQKNKVKIPQKVTVVSVDDKYVNFDLELYDKISTIYWSKMSDEQLYILFKLSLEKAYGSSTPQYAKNKMGVEKMLRHAFSYASTTDAKKQLAVNTAIVALYNIEPFGRNQMFSQRQEKQFRDSVANINPAKDLYSDVGVKQGAPVEEVKKAVEEKVEKLEKATTTEAKKELEKVKYAGEVLTNAPSKALYDKAKVEPTVKFGKIGSTFYADLRQIAPTSLYEMAVGIDNASTTKNMDTLIIDLRGNVGGALDFLPAFFGLFVGKDQFAFDLFSQGERKPQRTTQLKYHELDRFKEIAILTDNMTQSTAELTAATFKKFHMAKVVGKTTRGWGTVENTYPMDTVIDEEEKYILLLVNSITLRDDGQPIEGRGVTPDVDISNPNWKNELSKNFKSESMISALKTVLK